ncbi:tyrosine recombinase XerD [Pseudoclavibacter endophyticus]|uniref:Tyrosine recombinase XerD n=1 Tax=Pseudoclavibacter endophyticus TaxID=1778590 RepID=A0A6H9WHJ7_9MICO|nr:site-specific tyrosine recombinase XerD [Pseudoclavibacter endophyticus]KAB1650412.1 site-specific tyrosine recombinase XerD [Pseudoclavibacter endophyticus]GGA54331.1 tyrosine recombinase XerD [Pseudoclavibacter endophyticus]
MRDAGAGPGAAAADGGSTAAPALARQVERYLRHVTIERGLSPNSVAAYRRDLARYLGALGVWGVPDARSIRRSHVTEFVGRLHDGDASAGHPPMKPSSVARVLSAVRGWHRFLLDEELVDEDVAHDVAAPKQVSRLPKALTVDQVAAILDASGGDEPAQLRDRALLELLYATGARISEVVALDVDDLVRGGGAGQPTHGGAHGATDGGAPASGEDDASAARPAMPDLVRVRGKGDKQRLVPVGSFARRALDAYLVRARPLFSAKGRATPALFLGVRGARLSRQSAWHVLHAAAERAGLSEHVSPHVLRHSFATHLLQGGADVRVVQELLGHASVSTTQIYTLVTADALRDVYLTSHPRAR